MSHRDASDRPRRAPRVAAAAALLACAAVRAGETPVAFVSLARTKVSGVEAPTFVVVKDAGAWADLWRRHAAPVTPPPARPAVDFGALQVIGVFLGRRPNGCFGVEVRAVLDSPATRIVVYREQVPAPDALCTAQIVHPAHLVRVPASALPVEFRAE
jgi:hypothetical protein